VKIHATDVIFPDDATCGSQSVRGRGAGVSVREFVDLYQRGSRHDLCKRCTRSRAVQDALSHRRERRINPQPRDAT